MTWLISKWLAIVFGVGGVLLALWIAWRIRRGRSVAFSRNLSPRLIRTAAVVLVCLGFGASADEANTRSPRARQREADATSNGSAQPQPFAENMVTRWRYFQSRFGAGSGHTLAKQHLAAPDGLRQLTDAEYSKLDAQMTTIAGELCNLLREDVALVREGMSPGTAPPQRLLRVLDEMEKQGHYDHWFNAYLWRKARGADAADEDDLILLYTRIQRHARLTDALVQANFEVKPTRINPRAWMSKAGPSKAVRAQMLMTGAKLTEAANAAWQKDTATTWQRDAVVRLKLADASGPATLIREGQKLKIEPGDTFAFGRLDLILCAGEAPLRIEDLEFGALRVPPEKLVSVWSLADYMEISGFKHLQATAEAAIDGDERAARQLELALPLTHQAIRDALREQPDGKGAPRLRTLLVLFDDSLKVPSPAQAQPEKNALPEVLFLPRR